MRSKGGVSRDSCRDAAFLFKVTDFRQALRRKLFVFGGHSGFTDVTLLFSCTWEESGGGVG